MLKFMIGNIAEITLAVSAVIAVLLLFSPLLSRTYTAKWRYYVWLILAVRLIIPLNLSFPQAPIQFEAPSGGFSYTVQEPRSEPVQPDQTPPDPQSVQHIKSFDAMKLLGVIWIAGGAAFLLWQIAGYRRFLQFVHRWKRCADSPWLEVMLAQLCAEMQIQKKIRLYVCPKLQSPMMTGIFHPILLLPKEDYEEEALLFILRHELTHFTRRDIVYKLLLFAANAVHWFNPLIYLMVREANKDIEISCDEAVVCGMDREARGQYGETMLSVIHAGHKNATSFSTCFYGGGGTMKKRLSSLFDMRAKRSGIIALCTVAVTALLAGCLFACSVFPSDTGNRIAQRELTPEEQNILKLAGMGEFPVILEYTVAEDIRSVQFFVEAYQKGEWVESSGGQLGPVNERTGQIALSDSRADQTISWKRQHDGGIVSWDTAVPKEYTSNSAGHLENEKTIIADQPIILRVKVFDEDGNLSMYDLDMLEKNPGLIADYDYIYIEKCVFSTKTSDEIELPDLAASQSSQVLPKETASGEDAIRSLAQSVLYDPEIGELRLFTPTSIPEDSKLYLHVSGRMKMGDGSASWHHFEQETEMFSWKSGQEYFAYIEPNALEFIEITAGLVNGNGAEIQHETTITVDSAGRISDTKGYRAPDAPSAPEKLSELPKMTPENEAYARKYLAPVLASGFFYRSFNPQDYSQLGELHDEDGNIVGGYTLMYCFEDLTGAERMQQYFSKYEGRFPVDLIEGTLSEYFEMTQQQMREIMGNFYQPAKNIYAYEGGRGGGSVAIVVNESRLSGDLLELDYTLYGGGDSYEPYAQGTTALQIEPEGWKYVSNTVLK